MKILCVLADVPVMQQMADTMKQAAEKLEGAEIVFGNWLDGKEEDFSNIVLHIENKGPDDLPIPRIIQENYDADIILAAFCPLSKEMMDHMPNLKAICITRGGIENVNLKAASSHGIKVVNAAGRNANAVSDFTVGMMLCVARNIAQSHHLIKIGRPEEPLANENRIPDMEEKTVGLVGFGHIGRLVAQKLSGFHMDILVYDPFLTPDDVKSLPVKLVSKTELFSNSDFVSVHARLSEETHHMIGEDELAIMKQSSYLINTARAGLIDYDALYTALSEKRIAGAALDVFYQEPLPADSPWLSLDNVVLTGHMGGATADAQKKSPIIAVNKLLQFYETGNKNLLMNPDAVYCEGEKHD